MKILMIICILILLGFINYKLSMDWLKIKHLILEIEDLPEELKGLKILHISDIHNASETEISLDFWGDIADLDFDITAITGDMTVSRFEQILPLAPAIESLSKKGPVFFTDGNHEKNMYPEVKEFMEEAGAVVLDNEKLTLEYGAARFDIIGIRDITYLNKNGYTAFEKHLDGNENFKLVLEHQPQLFSRIKNYDNVLMLSGHTHGGQVRLPFVPTLYAPGQGFFPEYGDGVYRYGTSCLYISRGIGTTVFPLRFFNRPEIAIIELS